MTIPKNLLKWLQQHPDIREDEEKFQGVCPVHPGADNPTAFVVWKNTGVWRCYTHLCHLDGDRCRHLCKHLGIENTNSYEYSIDSFGTQTSKIKREQEAICTREEFLNRLCEYPSKYAHEQRDFPKYLLKKYGIGTSYKKGNMAYRCVCPIFSDDYKYVVGYSGRTIQDSKPKWLHSNFKSGHNLYNIWFAKTSIKQKKSVILVEGIFDVLRLEEAGIRNSVSTFGLNIGQVQERMFQKMGVQNIIFGFDNDGAASKAIEAIQKKYEMYYNFHIMTPPKKDWAECSSQEIKQHVDQSGVKKMISI